MTANVELLPLPEWASCDEIVRDMSTSEFREAMRDYARANMEALRAEVAGLRQALTDALDDIAAVERLAADSNARAERLAEALRMFLQAGVGNSTDFYVQHNATLAARDALAQEDRNG